MSLVKEAGHRAGPLAETPVSLGAGTAKRIRPAGGRCPPEREGKLGGEALLQGG